VKDIRRIALPRGGETLVGGASAQTVDLIALIGAHLPWMGAMVVAVLRATLFLAFGSVVLPLTAVVMNTVSLAASFGTVTWIFQDGHLSSLLGSTLAWATSTSPSRWWERNGVRERPHRG
jgi:RND superfamily putative drug exporter